MRVLVANKFWYRRGGLERVMFDEISWLRAAGHEVAHFSAMHPSNEESPWARYFVPYLDLGADSRLSGRQKIIAVKRMFSNPVARDRFGALAEEFNPDIVHAHGIHRQLSPVILEVARQRRVPVVQTPHDYHHVCPADVLLKGGSTVCEPRACGRLWYGSAVRYRCVRGSLAASTVSAAETGFQRVRGVYERTVSRFISPSRFLETVMRKGGWSVPCDVIPNAVPISEPGGGGEYVLYAGRFAPEKGVDVLLEAARAAGVRVIAAGEGPLLAGLRERFPEADFPGRVDGAEVHRLIAGAAACAVPSTWYENAPMSVLEPMAAGVPVIASAIGGIPEIIQHEVSGLLVPPGDVTALAGALAEIRTHPDRAAALGAAARDRVMSDFSPERHLALLLETYRSVVGS